MSDLNRWMEEFPPISPKLSQKEQSELKARILSKNHPKKKPVRMFFVLAATMCVLGACGAAAIGLFDTMASANQTSGIIEKYGKVLDQPQSVIVDNHTVTVQAVLRSGSKARVIYDISGTKKQVLKYLVFEDASGSKILRTRFSADGQQTGSLDAVESNMDNLMRQSGPIGEVQETKSTRYFGDVDLPENTENISFYVLNESGGAEVMQLALAQEIKDTNVQTDGAQVNFSAKGQADLNCKLESIKITPFGFFIQGSYSGDMQAYPAEKMNWLKVIRLYDAELKQIKVGKNGSFYGGSGGIGPKENPDFTVEVGSYDLIDPEAVSVIEIDGVRYPLAD